MNPTRTPGPPHLGRAYSSETVPNPLYSMHVNAAVAGPSTQRPHPRSNSSPTSFYPPHLAQQPRVPPPPIPSKPTSLTSPLPPSLMPGSSGRSRPGLLSSLESSLFFQPGPTSPTSSLTSSTVPKSHPYAQAPPSVSRPPLPPKPHVTSQTSAAPVSDDSVPQIPPKPTVASEQQTSTPPEERPLSADEDELVARALELSLQESAPVGNSDKEDDILARVLEESLASISSSAAPDTRAPQVTSPPKQLEIDSKPEAPSASSSSASCSSRSPVKTPTTPSHSHPAVTNNGETSGSQSLSEDPDLEALTKQEEDLFRAEREARQKQLEADEEFARSIALLEAESASSSSVNSPPSASVNNSSSLPSSSSDRIATPLYNTTSSATQPASFHVRAFPPQPQRVTAHFPLTPPSIVTDSRPLPAPGSSSIPSRGHRSYTAGCSTESTPAPPYHLGRSASAQASLSLEAESSGSGFGGGARQNDSRPYSTSVIPAPLRRNSGSSEGSSSSPTAGLGTRREGIRHTVAAMESIGPVPSEEAEDNELSSPIDRPDEGRMVSHSSPSSPPIVEEELLLGVSFGFNPPPLAASGPMQGPIPNVITLPYGRSPPLHIQAPSWKHLLKLLTRLSDSRVEPTVEALSGTKAEMKLRTVIQFMKIHHSSDEWRTIVYLTIDVPVPPLTPNIFKYTNGDVNTLPYSYTTSPLPALLRAGAGDSNLSKCFTVPTTASTPYPTLPMTLPDFALYLHSVLEDSRRAANDSSGGLRKLAKLVDTIYPASSLEGVGPEVDFPDRRGVGKFFRLLGRGNKESQSQRGGNAERYEFITPFRIDEYR